MQFKHPELLYTLFALLIPILIHLFQLRRFKKEAFTNVAFLKKIKLQTRKSSKIKKWLILFTRLILLAAIIIAFAQPYTTNKNSFKTEKETVIYLDNSFSMQAKGEQGELLKRAVQDIMDNINDNEKFSLVTNNSTYKDVTLRAIQNDLLTMAYSSNQLDYNAAILKSKTLFSKSEETLKSLIFISDFQQKKKAFSLPEDSTLTTHLVQLKPEVTSNTSIDSVSVQSNSASELSLEVFVKGETENNPTISLLNGTELIGKTTAEFQNGQGKATFTLPNNQELKGELMIDDNYLQFDNHFYFNINKPKIIQVLVVGGSNQSYFKRIFTENEFNLTQSELEKLNFSIIENQNLIILNELDNIPESLTNSLRTFSNEGGVVAIIPSNNSNIDSYNLITNQFGTRIAKKNQSEKKITEINFSHPLFDGVFNRQVTNFQYPKVESYYPLVSNSTAPLLFENGEPFLVNNGQGFIFSATLNLENSNFQNSPLIVPTFYNMAKKSLKSATPYFIIGENNEFDVSISLQQDDILSLSKDDISIIPQQQYYANKVVVKTQELPNQDGVYEVNHKENFVEYVSFNYDRNESDLSYQNISNLKNVMISNSISDAFEIIKSNTKVNELWKWFVIFALVFLALEILLLKFFK